MPHAVGSPYGVLTVQYCLYNHLIPMPHAIGRPYGVPPVQYCHTVQCRLVVWFPGCTIILYQCQMPSAAHMVCRLYNTVCTIILYQCHHCRPTHGLPPMVCRPSMVPMVCHQWCAAHPPCPLMVCRPSIFMALGPTVYTIYFIYHLC
jgi:hypothetical protein